MVWNITLYVRPKSQINNNFIQNKPNLMNFKLTTMFHIITWYEWILIPPPTINKDKRWNENTNSRPPNVFGSAFVICEIKKVFLKQKGKINSRKIIKRKYEKKIYIFLLSSESVSVLSDLPVFFFSYSQRTGNPLNFFNKNLLLFY